ncbi:MAG: lipid IV(A) 3-deoxy-D-manno-octulosonic acid transferase [Steroidobacterales bacterium]
MRRVYTLLLYLALPVASLVVLVRGLREREYWRGWQQRFGFGPPRAGGGVWVHAVSVGEVQAAAVLIEALRARLPGDEITLSCATPTARARGRALLPDLDVRYAPYDLPGSVRRCLAVLRPRLLIVLETELWPNLLHETQRAGVPILIASARVSARSARIYQRLPGLLRASLAGGVWVGAQTDADAQRFAALGVPPARLAVVGNIKFDRNVLPGQLERGAQLRARYAGARALWVAGSTHAGEEQIVLEAHRRLLEQAPGVLLILAPRHPQRFEAAAAAVAARGLAFARRSAEASTDGCAVLLLDTLGELADFYAAADVAFVGGSLVPVGGHNLLEPAALGLPVLSGPQQFNSPELARALSERGALTIVHDAAELAAALARLLADPQARAQQGAAGRAAIDANRGALERLLGLIERLPPQRHAA